MKIYFLIIFSLEQVNFVVLEANSVPEDLPWTHFNLIVDWGDGAFTSEWEKVCERLNISMILFSMEVNG